jgi:DNA-binding MarR family transcriptional regulator
MTHRLASLESAGLITRVPDPDDGRSTLVELTASGLALVDEVAPAHLGNERRLLAALSADEQQQLIDLLRKLLRSFEAGTRLPPPSGRGGRRRVAPDCGRRRRQRG